VRTIYLATGLAIAVFSAGGPETAAQDASAASVYMRTRGAADGAYGQHVPGYGHFPGIGYGYFQPYTPYVANSWYARPYPYHFDYFRGRWNGRPGSPASDCPCAEAMTSASPNDLLPQAAPPASP
jgi:hypothetical protein